MRAAIEGKHNRDGEDDVLSFTPSMIGSDLTEHEVSVSSRSGVSDLTEPSIVERQEEEEEVEATEQKSASTERTDTGALLQAGSIAAGVAGIALMMAFGGGNDKKKKRGKK